MAATTTPLTRGGPVPRPLPGRPAWRAPTAALDPPSTRCLASAAGDVDPTAHVSVTADVSLDEGVASTSPAEAAALAALAAGDAATAAVAALRAEAAHLRTPWPAGCDPASAQLSVVLARDAAVAALNEGWRGVVGPTDVLSFPMEAAGAGAFGGAGAAFGIESAWAGPQGDALRAGLMAGEGEEEEEEEEEEGDEEDGGEDGEDAPSPSPPSSSTPSLPPRVLGDVIISLDTAARQAAARG